MGGFDPWWRPWLRQAAGLCWIALWACVLGWAHAPWLQLGGLVGETVRYWERLILAAAAIAGCLVGDTARRVAIRGSGWTHRRLLRIVVLVPAAAVAIGLLVLRAAEARDWIGVVFVGLLGYLAGVDCGIGAWPLLRGRHYSFSGPIEPDATEAEESPRLEGDPRFR